ncbi:sugar transport protein 8 [Ricinus communis]|uniref:Sugar transporter, putative n=1 Tax=Ricinus communis TaxID=3988 RepID=B9RTZ5_RICCO|nr:sugar transport protein 8 [Ricinus communis]EEF45377.1 sugar transporter, putative [Ricinus communis]|eukprot:XP_002517214.1 sugar transport protein 8 [Ricinus communis]
MPAIIIANKNGDYPEYDGKITVTVIICVIIAACGGLMFGYDIGVSGGVTAMDDFLEKFFPSVYERKKHALENNYCKYDNQYLQLFTSSLYIAALIASFFASKTCTKFGRKPTMQLASIFFIVGVVLSALGVNIEMVIVGRVLLGFGVGFANQAVPLFLSELAPVKMRGALNISFQLFVTIGILIANLVNYYTGKIHPHGYKISLGLAGVPALMLGLGSLLIVETPTSLVERNRIEEGRAVLKKIRGVDNVDLEFDSIVHACEMARQVTDPYRKLMKRPSRPPLVIAILLQIFQQFTGINAIMFYAPVLFQTVGFGNDASLLSSVVTGLVNVLSTVVSIVVVDRAGRRILLLESCVQMLITQTIIGALLLKDLKPTGELPSSEAMVVVVMVCIYVAGFAWSWGPLGWLIPSETFPLETRTAGYSFAVSSNMLCTFIIAQAFLSMLCSMQAGIFFFFAAWIVVMMLFAYFFIPETKGVPVDVMVERVWKQHWFWKRFFDGEEKEVEQKPKMIHPQLT